MFADKANKADKFILFCEVNAQSLKNIFHSLQSLFFLSIYLSYTSTNESRCYKCFILLDLIEFLIIFIDDIVPDFAIINSDYALKGHKFFYPINKNIHVSGFLNLSILNLNFLHHLHHHLFIKC